MFVLPFFISGNDRMSISYMFGYCNLAGLISLLAVSLIFAFWSKGLGLKLPIRVEREKFPRTGLAVTAIAVVGCCLLWACSQGDVVFAEARYFLDRLEMMRLGEKVYSDLRFEYGPIMLYLPIWLSRILGISLSNGYFLSWILQWAVGVAVLWKTISLASRGTGAGRSLFLLLSSFWLGAILDGGTNYTPLRFSTSLLFALVVQRRYETGFPILAFAVASAGAVVLFLYSPEQGLAFVVATLAFFLFCVRAYLPGTLLALILFVCLAGSAIAIGFRMRLLDSVMLISNGFLNLPLFPSVQTVVLLTLWLIAASIGLWALRTGSSGHPLLYLICLSCASLPAALGRADPGHIVMNTMGAIIAVLVVLSQYPRLGIWASRTFGLVVILFWFAHLNHYRPQLNQELTLLSAQTSSPRIAKASTAILLFFSSDVQSVNSARHRIFNWQKDQSDPAVSKLAAHAHLFAPLGFDRRIQELPGEPEIKTGRYAYLFPINSPSMVQDKIGEIKDLRGEALILPESFGCMQDVRYIRLEIRKLLLPFYMPPFRTPPTIAATPLCDYISSHYQESTFLAPVPNWKIWIRRENKG